MKLNGKVRCTNCDREIHLILRSHDAPRVEVILTCRKCKEKTVVAVTVGKLNQSIGEIHEAKRSTSEPRNDSGQDSTPTSSEDNSIPTSDSKEEKPNKEEDDQLKALFDNIKY